MLYYWFQNVSEDRDGGPWWHRDFSDGRELAHRKAITDYPETATLGQINSEENIAVLCRNCHWEFDNGLLKLGKS